MNLNASAMQNFEHVACLRDKDKVLAIMPIFHGFGLEVSINDALCVGAEVVLIPNFQASKFHKLLIKLFYNFNFICFQSRTRIAIYIIWIS